MTTLSPLLVLVVADPAFVAGQVVGTLLIVGVVVGGAIWLLVALARGQSRPAGPRMTSPPPRFSDDGRWWWDGGAWRPAVSEDGQWRWDGVRWVRAM